jgi:MFS family permease
MRSAAIYASKFLYTSALGVVFVFLEDVQSKNNLADWEVGAIVGTGFGAALLVQLLMSPFADRGMMLPLALVALAAGIIGPLGFAFGTSTAMIAISRGLSGVGMGLYSMLAKKALIGRDAAGGGAKLGMLLSTAIAGFIAGPLIGAAFEPLGFEAPFVAVSIGIALIGIPAMVAIMGSEIATSPVDYSALGELIRRPRIQAAVLTQIIVMGYVGVFDAVIDRHLTGLGASTVAVAWVIAFVGLPMLFLPRFAGNRAEALGGSRVILPALVAIVPVMLGYSLVTSVVLFAVVGFLHGTTESFANISAQVLVLEVTGAKRAAVGSGLLEASGLLAATVSASVAPSVYGTTGRGLFVITAAVGSLLATAAVLRLRSAAALESDTGAEISKHRSAATF